MVTDNIILTKVCSRCKIDKELSEFGKAKLRKFGVTEKCRICINIYYKEYLNLNLAKKNKKAIGNKKWLIANKENRIAYRKIYTDINKDIIKAKRKKYRDENRDDLLKRERELHNKNKDSINNKKRVSYEKSKEKYREAHRVWSKKNKIKENERCKIYRNNNREYLNEKSREWRQRNPERAKARDKQRIENVTNGYCVNSIAGTFNLTANERKLIPSEVIELKKATILLKRQLKKQKDDTTQTNV